MRARRRGPLLDQGPDRDLGRGGSRSRTGSCTSGRCARRPGGGTPPRARSTGHWRKAGRRGAERRRRRGARQSRASSCPCRGCTRDRWRHEVDGRRVARGRGSSSRAGPVRLAYRAYRRFADAVTGMKPLQLVAWVFAQLGALVGDELVDLYPGSGAGGEPWRRYTALGPVTGEVEFPPGVDERHAACRAARADGEATRGVPGCRYEVAAVCRGSRARMPGQRGGSASRSHVSMPAASRKRPGWKRGGWRADRARWRGCARLLRRPGDRAAGVGAARCVGAVLRRAGRARAW